MELYKKYRPTTFKEVVGQKEALRKLASMHKREDIPHTILFTGPSGCGKTTIARILRDKLKCADVDFEEKNAADDRGIEMARDIGRKMSLRPIGGPCRVYLIDEAHQLTTAGQDCLLKILEDTPSHVYFFLCTTDPKKLKKTILTRCTEIRVKPLTDTEARLLLTTTASKEEQELTDEVLDEIVEAAEGSARKLLVLLHEVIGIADPKQQLEAVQKQSIKKQSIDLARMLMTPQKGGWKKVAEILKALDDEPETIRRMILGYCSAVMLSGGHEGKTNRAFVVADAMRENFYDTGKNGLVLACYEVFHEV